MSDMTHLYETWLIYMRHDYNNKTTTQPHPILLRRDSFLCFTCVICTRHVSFIWLIRMRHDSFIWDMTRPYETCLLHVRHDAFIWDTTHACDMPHAYTTRLIHMKHDSFICDMTHSHETWRILMRHDTCMQHTSYICDMTHSCVKYDPWLTSQKSVVGCASNVSCESRVKSQLWVTGQQSVVSHGSKVSGESQASYVTCLIQELWPVTDNRWLLYSQHMTHPYETCLTHMKHASLM